jgi:hypothetical protein
MKHIFDKDFVYTPSHRTSVAETFARFRSGNAVNETIDPKCTCEERRSWWDCKTRGCRKLALQRYGETVVRFEPRADHDLGPDGCRLKAGK